MGFNHFDICSSLRRKFLLLYSCSNLDRKILFCSSHSYGTESQYHIIYISILCQQQLLWYISDWGRFFIKLGIRIRIRFSCSFGSPYEIFWLKNGYRSCKNFQKIFLNIKPRSFVYTVIRSPHSSQSVSFVLGQAQ